MQNLVEDFLTYRRHERGQSKSTADNYSAYLHRFIAWAGKQLCVISLWHRSFWLSVKSRAATLHSSSRTR